MDSSGVFTCRICLSAVETKHSTALFTASGLSQGWPNRISELLHVEVKDDSLPSHICRLCKLKVISLEGKLQSLRALAQESLRKLQDKRREERKRCKDTSGTVGVSPYTANVRPPAKRQYGAARRSLFPTSDNSFTVEAECTTADAPPLMELGVNRPLLAAAPQEGSQDSGAQTQLKSVQITVSTPSRPDPYCKVVEESLCKVGRALAGGHPPTIAKMVLAHDGIREHILLKLIDQISAECGKLCQRATASLFRKIPVASLPEFRWDSCIKELEVKAPTLLKLLTTIVSTNDHRNQHKRGERHYPGVCIAIATLLKERNREMNGIQTFLSLVLFTSRVQKQVYSRLNHLNVSLSYNGTLAAVTEVSTLHKVPLNQWIAQGVTFKFVGDNMDKKKGFRDIRVDHQAELQHMYSMLAVRSRVPSPPLDDRSSIHAFGSLQPSAFLPTIHDIRAIQDNLVVLVSRILCRNVKHLSIISNVVPAHIRHQYSGEMAKKSEVIVLDVLMKNEAKNADMLDIMQTMQRYLGENFPLEQRVLSGGDQLTCERQVGAKRHMMDGDTSKDRLDEFEIQTEDWHALMSFLGVIWKALFTTSSRDHGTLGHLCSLLGRLPKAKDPKKDFNACSDALFTILEGHFVAAACEVLEIRNPDEEPASLAAIKGSCPDEEKRAYVYRVAREVVNKYSVIAEAVLNQDVEDHHDHVNNYARVFCHFGSLALEFTDAWREGDGERIVRCWGIFLLHFHAARRTKYALEALNLKLQLASLPSSLAHQIKWNRFVNTHGGQGCNVPCDLHNEHVNKLFKEIIANMGANLKEEALTRAARSVTALECMKETFDKQSGVSIGTSGHSTQSNEDDIRRVVFVLQSDEVLAVKAGRKHSRFPKISANPLHCLKMKQLKIWIKQKHAKHAKKMKIALTTSEESESDLEENLSELECVSDLESISDFEEN